MTDPVAIQAKGRKAVYLLWKLLADRTAEFRDESFEVSILRDVVEDPDFLKLAEKKIHERNP